MYKIDVNNYDLDAIKCPYEINDKFWVKETWSPDHKDFYPHYSVILKADNYPSKIDIDNGMIYSPESKRKYPFKWRSPVLMPREASRFNVMVESIKIEEHDGVYFWLMQLNKI